MAPVPAPCANCGAMLGPWELTRRSTCLRCGPSWRHTESADAKILTVLEASAEPLYIWDVQRLTARRRYMRPATATVSQTLGALQYCWAGRSLYGLYRHGLIPGARDLGTVAAAVLQVTDGYLTTGEVHFVMRQLGYRYAIGSIGPALARSWDSDLIIAYTDGTFGGRPSDDGERTIARALGFSQRGPAFYAVMDRLRQQVSTARSEYERRAGSLFAA